VRELSAYEFVDARYKKNNSDKIFINNAQTLKFCFLFSFSKSGYLWHTVESVFLALCGRRIAI
jgi:hypothetical protein